MAWMKHQEKSFFSHFGNRKCLLSHRLSKVGQSGGNFGAVGYYKLHIKLLLFCFQGLILLH